MADVASATPTKTKLVKLSSLKRNIQAEADGEWIDAEDFPGTDIAWNVRSINYPPYVKARDAANIRLRNKHKKDAVPEEAAAEVYGKLIVDYLLLGWRGIADDDGNETPFSKEAALAELTQVEASLVRGSILFAASKVGLSELEFVEDSEKN